MNDDQALQSPVSWPPSRHLTLQNVSAVAAVLSFFVYAPLYVYASSFARELDVSIEELGVTQPAVVLGVAANVVLWVGIFVWLVVASFPIWAPIAVAIAPTRGKFKLGRRVSRILALASVSLLLTSWLFVLPDRPLAEKGVAYLVASSFTAVILWGVARLGGRVLLSACIIIGWGNLSIAATFLGGAGATRMVQDGTAAFPVGLLGLVGEKVEVTSLDDSELPGMSEEVVLLRQSGGTTLLIDLTRRQVVRVPTGSVLVRSAVEPAP